MRDEAFSFRKIRIVLEQTCGRLKFLAREISFKDRSVISMEFDNRCLALYIFLFFYTFIVKKALECSSFVFLSEAASFKRHNLKVVKNKRNTHFLTSILIYLQKYSKIAYPCSMRDAKCFCFIYYFHFFVIVMFSCCCCFFIFKRLLSWYVFQQILINVSDVQ